MTRNERLKADKAAGFSVAYICGFYKISKSRLYQILSPEGYKGQQARAKAKKAGASLEESAISDCQMILQKHGFR
jgi:hypothetical protein